MRAELNSIICSGPSDQTQHTYVLADEVLPATLPLQREEALVRLAHRFFRGHGPAEVKDFTRWSSLTVADAELALSHLSDQLERVEVDGLTLWFDPTVPSRTTAMPPAILFPVYDEAILSYPRLGFPAADGHPYGEHPDPFWAFVVIDTTNVGMWKRTIRGTKVEVETHLATSLSADDRDRVRAGAQRLADLLERDLVFRENDGAPALWGGDAGHPARRPRRADRKG